MTDRKIGTNLSLAVRHGLKNDQLPLTMHAKILTPSQEELSHDIKEKGGVIGVIGSISISQSTIQAHLALQRGGRHRFMRNNREYPHSQYITIDNGDSTAMEITPILTKGWRGDSEAIVYGWIDKDTLQANKKELPRHYKILAKRALAAANLSSRALAILMEYYHQHDDLPKQLIANSKTDKHYTDVEALSAAAFYEIMWSAEQA